MSGESPGDEADAEADAGDQREDGEGPPTEAEVEAAKEELAAVGAADDGDDPDESTVGATGDDDSTDVDADSDESGETESPAGAETDEDDRADDAEADGDDRADDENDPDDAEADGDDRADDADASDDGQVHAEDLVEDPEERPEAKERERVESTEEGAGTAGSVDADDAAGTAVAADASAGADAGASTDAAGDAPDATGASAGPAVESAGVAPDESDATVTDPDASVDDAPDAATGEGEPDATEPAESEAEEEESSEPDHQPGVPEDVRKYDRFKKVDGAQYDRVNEFLRERTYVTAREWAIARLCSDFRTETGVEMTKIGENLPELVPFMTDTYTAQAVNQARASFEEKVRQAGATFLYGAMCDFFTAEELDDVMYESTEVAKFLLEVEGVELTVEEELEAEDRISAVMRDVRESSAELRHESCPECGAELSSGE